MSLSKQAEKCVAALNLEDAEGLAEAIGIAATQVVDTEGKAIPFCIPLSHLKQMAEFILKAQQICPFCGRRG